MKYPYIVNKNGTWYPSGAEVPEDNASDVELTKTDINRMPVAELRKKAAENGLDNPGEMTGGELKKYLIKTLGL